MDFSKKKKSFSCDMWHMLRGKGPPNTECSEGGAKRYRYMDIFIILLFSILLLNKCFFLKTQMLKSHVSLIFWLNFNKYIHLIFCKNNHYIRNVIFIKSKGFDVV